MGSGGSSSGTRARPSWRALLLVVLPAALVVGLFCWNVREYCFLGDDAFISFRYAKHLSQGHGLVWNPGERVEGYTNFLWVLLMSASIQMGLPVETTSRALGIASGACLLGVLVLTCARATSWRNPFIWLAPLSLASSRTFTAWCTGGLETMFFVLLVYLAYLHFFRERTAGATAPVVSSLVFSASALTRPEGGLFAFVAGCSFGVEVLLGRRRLRSALLWALPFLAIVGAHALWRHAYYGAWLPNTFYAKVPGLWWEQGARYLSLFADDYRFAWFLPLLLPSLVLRPRFETITASAAAIAYLAYVAAIGGDRFEFRFLVVLLPLAYGMMADSLFELTRLPARSVWARHSLQGLAVAVAATLLVATYTGSRRPDAQQIRHGVASVRSIAQYARLRIHEGRFLRRLIDDELLPPDLVLAVSGAGAVPYYTEWPTVDTLGLSDARIARMPIGQRGIVAHERSAPYEYLREREVVIFDVLNRIVRPRPDAKRGIGHARYDGRLLPLKMVRVRGRYLIFATLVSDAELERRLGALAVEH